MTGTPLPVLKGTLDVLILKTLSWGPAHGYNVTRAIDRLTEGALLIEEGVLYPALHRLERRGLVDSQWGVSENNRKAKYYRLTAAGRRELQRVATGWHRFADAMAKVLAATERPA